MDSVRGKLIGRKRRPQAFTLVELLVALSILAVISAISFSSFQSISRVVDVNRQNEEAQRSVRGFLERLDVELAGAVYVRDVEQTMFISQRRDIGEKKVNTLVFTALMPQSYLEVGTREEIVKVEYLVEENEKKRDHLVVKKRVFFHLLSPDMYQEPAVGPAVGLAPGTEAGSAAGPAEFVIRDDFTSFTMRFYEGGKWFESWDSKTMSLIPDGVELIFSLGGKTFREYFNVFISET